MRNSSQKTIKERCQETVKNQGSDRKDGGHSGIKGRRWSSKQAWSWKRREGCSSKQRSSWDGGRRGLLVDKNGVLKMIDLPHISSGKRKTGGEDWQWRQGRWVAEYSSRKALSPRNVAKSGMSSWELCHGNPNEKTPGEGQLRCQVTMEYWSSPWADFVLAFSLSKESGPSWAHGKCLRHKWMNRAHSAGLPGNEKEKLWPSSPCKYYWLLSGY